MHIYTHTYTYTYIYTILYLKKILSKKILHNRKKVVPRRNACDRMGWDVVPLQAHNVFWLCRLDGQSPCAQPLRTTPAHNLRRTTSFTQAHNTHNHCAQPPRTTPAHNLRAQPPLHNQTAKLHNGFFLNKI